MESYKKEEDVQEKDIDIAIGMGNQAIVQREGEATSQIIQAYKGVRYDSNGVDLEHKGRNFKDIKNYKINQKYIEQNIKQQAGFDAELIDEARRNKLNIQLDNSQRVRTSDGIGQTNNTKYDHVVLDAKGNIILGSESQMKFYGTKLQGQEVIYRVIDKIAQDESWNRYDTLIDIPAEQYEGARSYAEKKASSLREQAIDLRKNNKNEIAQLLEQKADSYDYAGKKIRKSTVKTEEAIQARLNPELFTTKEIVKDINHAGIETAKGAILISSAIYTAQNIYSVMADNKSVEDVVVDVTTNIAKTGVVGYGLGIIETSIKTVMHSSNQELIRRCGNSSLPTAIATGIVEVTKSLKKYASGEISEDKLLIELGEKGVGMMACGYGATVGTIIGSVIPIEKKDVFTIFKTIQILKKILDVPLLNKKGEITKEAQDIREYVKGI